MTRRGYARVRTDVNTRQTVLPRYLLGPQVLLHLASREEKAFVAWVKRAKEESGQMGTHGQRVVRPAFDRRVVDHDDALAPGYPADTRDEPSARNGLPWIDVVSGQGREFKEGGVCIQEQRQPMQGREDGKPADHQQSETVLLKRGETRHLSRGSFFPLLLMRSAAFAPPPARAMASFASRSATTWSMASARARNSGEDDETRDGRSDVAWYDRAVAGIDEFCLDVHRRDGAGGVMAQRPARRKR